MGSFEELMLGTVLALEGIPRAAFILFGGAWDRGYNPVQPGLIVAGKNPVVTDAVSTALMGFDPDAASGSHRFS